MHILLVIPTPLDSQQGNTITARRYKKLLANLGHTTEIANSYDQQEADVLIAIHAVKSADSITKWKETTNKPCVLLLGGTDIYRDQHTHKNIYTQSLKLTDKIIVLEERAFEKIEKKHQHKAHIIHQSAYEIKNTLSLSKPTTFQICVAGHLRDTKNPFFTIEQITKTYLDVNVLHIGKDLTGSMGHIAKGWEKKDKRYKWLGNVSHKEALQIIQQSAILSHPTFIDSGPSVLIESLTLKTPVISSCIDGNISVLGDKYEGCFNLDTPEKFIVLLQKSMEDKSFYKKLQEQCAARQKLFTQEKEQACLKKIFSNIGIN